MTHFLEFKINSEDLFKSSQTLYKHSDEIFKHSANYVLSQDNEYA